MATIVDLKQQLIDCIEGLDKSRFGLVELSQCVALTSQLSQIGDKPMSECIEDVLQALKPAEPQLPFPTFGFGIGAGEGAS